MTSLAKKCKIKVHDLDENTQGEFTALLMTKFEALKKQGIQVFDINTLETSDVEKFEALFHANLNKEEGSNSTPLNHSLLHKKLLFELLPGFVTFFTHLKHPDRIEYVLDALDIDVRNYYKDDFLLEHTIDYFNVALIYPDSKLYNDTNSNIAPQSANVEPKLQLFFFDAVELKHLISRHRASYETLNTLPPEYIKEVAYLFFQFGNNIINCITTEKDINFSEANIKEEFIDSFKEGI